MSTLSKAAEILKTHPRVRYLSKSKPCTGWMSKKKQCKKPARWKFRAKRSRNPYRDSESGTFCYQHLWCQLYTNTEYDALQKWYEKNHGRTTRSDSEANDGSDSSPSGEHVPADSLR